MKNKFINHETEYALQQFRQEQPELFNSMGAAFDRISHKEPMTRMLKLIDMLECELSRHSAEQNIQLEIMGQIYIAFEDIGAKSDLLGIIGSYGDVVSDADVLNYLKAYNTPTTP